MKVINEDTLGVIDIGVFCPPAFEELSLDSKFKRLKFVGLDRSKQILDWNDTAFNLRGDINYMPFSSGNFVPPKMNLEGFVAVHMRTATLMKRDEVQQMYTELYNLGVQTIVAIEFVGLSKKHMLFADFSGDESIPMRFPMTIHPLNRIANEAGFLAHLNFYKPKPIILQDFGLGESVGISIFQRK
jgi:hypothetical protein